MLEFINADKVPKIIPILFESYLKNMKIGFADEETLPSSFYYPKKNIGVINVSSLREVYLRHGLVGMEIVPCCWISFVLCALELIAKVRGKQLSWAYTELLLLSSEFNKGGCLEIPPIEEFGSVAKKLMPISEVNQICLDQSLAATYETAAYVMTDGWKQVLRDIISTGIGRIVFLSSGLPKVFLSFEDYFNHVHAKENISDNAISEFPESLIKYVRGKIEKIATARL